MKFIDLINENTNVDKERNRVKTIHKAIRRGVVIVEGYRFRYELPEEYTFHMIDDVLTQTAIKFTFYNKDIKINGGGVNLPLKVWRIEEGKDIFVNERLSNDDVSDIIYGDEYLLNTRSGVDYTNVKSKVRNKYRDFDINAIMTTPNDVINESTDEYTQKQIKKAKTIYKALRKGTIGGDNPEEPHFFYELSDDFSVHTTHSGIVISSEKIKIKHLNRGCLLHSTDYMGSLIRKRFNLFGIILTNPYKDLYFDYEVDAWESPLNEEMDNNLTEKNNKKIELIYKLFKTGKYQVDDLTYTYVLPDDFWTSNDDESGELIIVLTMNPQQTMKLYTSIKKQDGTMSHPIPVEKEYHHIHNHAKDRIKKKFEQFGIDIIF